jgi:hypothetical protein
VRQTAAASLKIASIACLSGQPWASDAPCGATTLAL